MNSQNNTPQNRVEAKYHEKLISLAGQKGTRNGRLLGLVTLGIMTGRSDEQIENEIISASGSPPLSSDEARHALETARLDTQPLTDCPTSAKKWKPKVPKPPPLGGRASSFVQRKLEQGQGATFETLTACSPIPIPQTPILQTYTFLQTLFRPEEWVFCGDRYSSGCIGDDIDTCAEWIRLIGGHNLHIAEFMICNPLTGEEGKTKAGKPSFRCGACVASKRFALVEFDALPLDAQAAFWSGVIGKHILQVRSLVYSGGKSIHGLVEISKGDSDTWKKNMEILRYATCHPDAPPEYKADRACCNPDRLTRLAGGKRSDNGKLQSLLWLSQ